jgi:hypothetical protein
MRFLILLFTKTVVVNLTLKNKAKSWYGKLPSPGWSKNRKSNVVKITLGSTRGYADYTMTVKIDSYDWKD